MSGGKVLCGSFAVMRDTNSGKDKSRKSVVMPKILGIDIPGKKRVEYSLRSIYGIGLSRAQDIVRKAHIDPVKRADDLTGDELTKITNIIQDGYVLEGDLRREVAQNIRRLISISSYRGLRYIARDCPYADSGRIPMRAHARAYARLSALCAGKRRARRLRRK